MDEQTKRIFSIMGEYLANLTEQDIDLIKENARLRKENEKLRILLKSHEIFYSDEMKQES